MRSNAGVIRRGGLGADEEPSFELAFEPDGLGSSADLGMPGFEVAGYLDGVLLWSIPMVEAWEVPGLEVGGYSDGIFLWGIPMGHSDGALLWGIPMVGGPRP